MADTFTTNTKLTKFAAGSRTNTWGDDFALEMDKIDALFGTASAIATTGGTTTLSDTQIRTAALELTGTLISNAIIAMPDARARVFVVNNACVLGAFSVTAKHTSGSAVTLPAGLSVVYFDGTVTRALSVGAPTSSAYVTIGSDATLTAERALAVGSALSLTDGGAGGNVTLDRAALTGDVTASAGSNATTIAANAVTYAKMQDVSATQRLHGRNTAGAGDPEEVTATQVMDWIGSTRGAILYRGASGWAILAPGTSGLFLKSNGAGADPSYASAGLSAAVQSDQESASSNVLAVTPGTQQFHPSAPKAWGIITYSGGVPTLAANYGVASIADTATATCTVTLSTAFSSSSYAVVPGLLDTSSRFAAVSITSTTVFVLHCWTDSGSSGFDPLGFTFSCFGDLP